MNNIIENKAEETLKRFELDKESYIDMVLLAKKMQIQVGHALTKDNYLSFVLVGSKMDSIFHTGQNKIIGIDANQSLEEKRFLIALELSYYVLKYHGQKYFAHKTTNSDKYNKDAYQLALALLMPNNVVLSKFNEFKQCRNMGDITKGLALCFKVSETCVFNRLMSLNLVTLA